MANICDGSKASHLRNALNFSEKIENYLRDYDVDTEIKFRSAYYPEYEKSHKLAKVAGIVVSTTVLGSLAWYLWPKKVV
jgi:hypothetical protein